MTVAVSVFNANTDQVNVNINNSSSGFSINGTTAALSFYPMTPTASDAPTFGSRPGPNVLGPGSNSLAITPVGVNQPGLFTLQIPTTQQIISLQLYVFWDSATTIGYALLNNGQVLAMENQPYGSPS